MFGKNITEVKVFFFTVLKRCLLSPWLVKGVGNLDYLAKVVSSRSLLRKDPTPACPRSVFWESVTKSSPHARRGNYFHLTLNYKHVYILLQLFGNSINAYIVIQPMGSDIWLEKLPFVCHLVCVRFLLMFTVSLNCVQRERYGAILTRSVFRVIVGFSVLVPVCPVGRTLSAFLESSPCCCCSHRWGLSRSGIRLVRSL